MKGLAFEAEREKTKGERESAGEEEQEIKCLVILAVSSGRKPTKTLFM